jgi:drug/metabolite transporter (DMT)-like permease
VFLLVIVNALFATTFTICKAALNTGITPVFLIGLRMSIAGFCLLTYWYLFGLTQKGKIKENLKGVILYTCFGIAVAFLVGSWVLRNTTSIKLSLVFNLSPFISALLSYFMLKEKINRKRWIGLSVGLFGFVPLALCSTESSSILKLGIFDFLMLVPVFAYTYGWVQMRALVKNGMSPIWVNGVAMLFTGVVCIVVSLVTSSIGIISSWPHLIFLVVLVVIMVHIISYVSLGFLLKRYTATFVMLSGLLRPVFATIYGYIFLGEAIRLHFFISMACVCAGLYIFYKQEASKISL